MDWGFQGKGEKGRNAGEGGVGSPTIETSFRVLVVLVVLDDNDVDSTLM